MRNAIIDSAHESSAVYQFCLSTGWKAFRGDDAEYFLKKGQDGKTKRMIYHKTRVDPYFGTKKAGRVRKIPLYLWSNPAVKDLLASYRHRLIGSWSIPRNTPAEYLRQVTAEKRVEERDIRGRIHYRWHQIRKDNHLGDCELMILVAAVASKAVQYSS